MTPNPLELPLRDIHLPAAIHWWPLAFGWWIVVGLILLLILSFFLFAKLFRPSQLKKQAEQALNRIEQRLSANHSAIQCLADLSVLLRRLTLQQNSSDLAGLAGREWLKQLDHSLKQPEFSEGIGKILLAGPYQKDAKKEDVFQLIELCRKWIKKL